MALSAQSKLLIVVGGVLVLLSLTVFIVLPIFVDNEDSSPLIDQAQLPSEPINRGGLTTLPADNQVQNSVGIPEPIDQRTVADDEASSRADVERLTRLFVERFGSYSNFSGFQNITSLQGLMTESMSDYAESIRQGGQSNPGSGYYGVTTRLLNLQVVDLTVDQEARATITVQREIQDGLQADIQRELLSGEVRLKYQDGKWLVDGVFYN